MHEVHLSTAAHALGFLPGERVPETGVYQVTHSSKHTGPTNAVFESGKKFPLCASCFWSVRYILVSQCSPHDMQTLRLNHPKGAK